MKKIVLYAFRILFVMSMIQLTGCHKFFDWHHHDPNPPVDCKITKIVSYGIGTPDTNTLSFQYNAQGNPDSIIPAVQRPGWPHYFFGYDTLGRLQQLGYLYYSSPADGNYSHLYFFSYTGNKITSCSIATNGYFINRVFFNKNPSIFQLFEYDSLDRVSKVSTKYPFDPTVYVKTYAYNADGNLTDYPAYDNKVNIFQTNKIWMFLAKDYSRNNPLTGAVYNSWWLPVKTQQTTGGRPFLDPALTIDHAKITYVCQ